MSQDKVSQPSVPGLAAARVVLGERTREVHRRKNRWSVKLENLSNKMYFGGWECVALHSLSMLLHKGNFRRQV